MLTRPWESIVADSFVFHGKDYLATSDRYSLFFEVERLYSKSSSDVITNMKAHIARYGIPNKLMSDNRPIFTSREFKLFSDSYSIEHITSSPTNAQSNGKAENSVKTAKKIMQKALDAHADAYLGILRRKVTQPQRHSKCSTDEQGHYCQSPTDYLNQRCIQECTNHRELIKLNKHSTI